MSGTDRELEALRRRRLAELQRAMTDEAQQEEEQQLAEEQKQTMLKRVLTSEARQRLANVKMVRPQLATQLELTLIRAAQEGKIKIPVTDQTVKSILAHIQSLGRETKIRRA